MNPSTLSTTLDLDDRVQVPDAPNVPGLVFRRFRGPEDYPHMADIFNACKPVDGYEESRTAEDVAHFYAHLVNCDPWQDLLFFEVDGQPAGYTRGEWRQDGEGQRLYIHMGLLKPEHRRHGIGRAALRYIEGRLRQVAAGHPAGGARFFQTFALLTEPGRIALLEQEGYTAARYGYTMVRPLDEPIQPVPLPAGLEVRPAGPEHYRAVWEADAEAFRDHWGYVPPEEEDYQRWLDDPNFNPQRWQVAWDGDQVVGIVQNFVNENENAEYGRRRGYTEGISVQRAWRRRGVARALLTRSLEMFRGQGFDEACLGVDAQNPNGALQLYQSVGFRAVREERVYRKPM